MHVCLPPALIITTPLLHLHVQAVWHGAHVAVKLMAADVAAHVDATALEAVVGLAVSGVGD